PGPRHDVAAGQVAGRQQIDQPEGPHEPGGRAPDVSAVDLERERERGNGPDADGRVVDALDPARRHLDPPGLSIGLDLEGQGVADPGGPTHPAELVRIGGPSPIPRAYEC